MAPRASGLHDAFHDQLHESAGINHRDFEEGQRGAQGARSQGAKGRGQHADSRRIKTDAYARIIYSNAILADERNIFPTNGVPEFLIMVIKAGFCRGHARLWTISRNVAHFLRFSETGGWLSHSCCAGRRKPAMPVAFLHEKLAHMYYSCVYLRQELIEKVSGGHGRLSEGGW